MIDPRFQVKLKNYWGKPSTHDATPRSSDGQLLFLMEMVSKMKSTKDSKLGARIASVHNGSSLNAVSWYDADAVKVINKKLKLSADKLADLLAHRGCAENDLADFGYYKQDDGSFVIYEYNTDLRDAESVPMKQKCPIPFTVISRRKSNPMCQRHGSI